MTEDIMAKDSATLDLGKLSMHLGYALRRAQIAVFDDVIDALSDFDLRPAQYSVLLAIEENPGHKQSEIAMALGIQRPNFVAMLDRLQKRGLITRTRSRQDRRSHAVQLTPAGAALLRQARDAVRQHECNLGKLIGAGDRDRLLALLWRLTGAIETRNLARLESRSLTA